MLPAFLCTTLLLLLGQFGFWLWSLRSQNVNHVDTGWGLGFVVANLSYAIPLQLDHNLAFAPRSVLFTTLVTLWGVRLAFHLSLRNSGKPEDPRYRAMRDARPGTFTRWSLFGIFLLQGGLMALLSAPFWLVHAAALPHFTVFDYAGVFLWLVGFIFEAGADFQLLRFKQDPSNRGKLLTTGLWGLSQHPNYFGETLVWWAFACFSFAAPWGWTGVLSSLAVTFLLLNVSGIPLLQKQMRTRPGYEEYQRRTPLFIPKIRGRQK